MCVNCETCKYKSDCFLAKDNYKVEECTKYKPEETEVSE